MENLRVATAQFEHKSGDKEYNLSVIREMSSQASAAGADVIAFHECSIPGYTFARKLSRNQMVDIAEVIPGGDSTSGLIEIAKENGIIILSETF
jgi:predicted amidohydrolase